MTYISTQLKKEIQISELITVHYFEYMKDFIFHGESHDFWEFLYVDKGCVSVQADETFYQLDAGDIIFHKPNEFHAIEAKGNKAPNLVAISFTSNSSAMKFFNSKYFTLSKEERKIISQIIAEAKAAFTTPLHLPSIEQVESSETAPFGAEQLVQIYLELFLIHVKRNHMESEGEKITTVPIPAPMDLPANSELLAQIIHYMEFRICEQLTVTHICEQFSLSRSALQSLFHKEKHCGAMDYFNQMKLERAKEIMRDGTMNLTEIAHYLSYSSLQYFSKQFKKATGMSPLEYSSSVKGITQAVERATSHLYNSQP
ncbi:AraC family transcriptional regulator [Lachnospiraceae bacterium LCP25S3_G4]